MFQEGDCPQERAAADDDAQDEPGDDVGVEGSVPEQGFRYWECSGYQADSTTERGYRVEEQYPDESPPYSIARVSAHTEVIASSTGGRADRTAGQGIAKVVSPTPRITPISRVRSLTESARVFTMPSIAMTIASPNSASMARVNRLDRFFRHPRR